jgi:hypothetical protein
VLARLDRPAPPPEPAEGIRAAEPRRFHGRGQIGQPCAPGASHSAKRALAGSSNEMLAHAPKRSTTDVWEVCEDMAICCVFPRAVESYRRSAHANSLGKPSFTRWAKLRIMPLRGSPKWTGHEITSTVCLPSPCPLPKGEGFMEEPLPDGEGLMEEVISFPYPSARSTGINPIYPLRGPIDGRLYLRWTFHSAGRVASVHSRATRHIIDRRLQQGPPSVTDGVVAEAPPEGHFGVRFSTAW